MGSRLELHAVLLSILGSKHVYYQPPESVNMSYPAIVYTKVDERVVYANNTAYAGKTAYTVIVIDSDPDSLLPGKVGALPTCGFRTRYTANNLNHDVYRLYY